MDVLFLIKEDHDRIRSILQSIKPEAFLADSAGSESLLELQSMLNGLIPALKQHLYLEECYLYPEVAAFISGAKVSTDIGLANIKVMRRQIDDLLKFAMRHPFPLADVPTLGKRLLALFDLIQKHFFNEEEFLMPKIRTGMPTQEREDLGHVLIDSKDEWRQNKPTAMPSEHGKIHSPKHGLKVIQGGAKKSAIAQPVTQKHIPTKKPQVAAAAMSKQASATIKKPGAKADARALAKQHLEKSIKSVKQALANRTADKALPKKAANSGKPLGKSLPAAAIKIVKPAIKGLLKPSTKKAQGKIHAEQQGKIIAKAPPSLKSVSKSDQPKKKKRYGS